MVELGLLIMGMAIFLLGIIVGVTGAVVVYKVWLWRHRLDGLRIPYPFLRRQM